MERVLAVAMVDEWRVRASVSSECRVVMAGVSLWSHLVEVVTKGCLDVPCGYRGPLLALGSTSWQSVWGAMSHEEGYLRFRDTKQVRHASTTHYM